MIIFGAAVFQILRQIELTRNHLFPAEPENINRRHDVEASSKRQKYFSELINTRDVAITALHRRHCNRTAY